MASSDTLKRPSLFDAFRNERNILQFFGFPLSEGSFSKKVLVKTVISLTISFTLIVSMATKIVIEIENVPVILEILYFGLTQTTFLCKIVNLLVRKGEYNKLESFLANSILTTYVQEQDIFIERAVYANNLYARTFRYMVGMTIIFYCIFPFIESGLPLPGWFPFDVEKYHYPAYLYQISAITLNGYNHSSLDCVCTGYISLASAQFEILKDNLTQLRREEDECLTEEELEVVVNVRIRESVEQQNEVIKFVNQIEIMFSRVIFVQFLCSVIIICVTGFQIFVMSPSRMQYITLVLYFFCNLTQVSLFSWFGQDILTKSSDIGDACYMSDWHKLSPRSRKLLLILMERAKRPIMLSVGKVINLNLATFMSMLRTSYSYFAVLQQMYKNK